MELRGLTDEERDWVEQVMVERWKAPTVVSRGRVHRPRELAGLVVLDGERRVGLLTYRVEGDVKGKISLLLYAAAIPLAFVKPVIAIVLYVAVALLWLVTLDALVEGAGVGTMLLDAAAEAARSAGCRRLWVITTNDNVHALRFYQRRGFALAALHRDAVTKARRLKPEISLVGEHGIPIRDELELERLL